jgi:BolA protein
VRERIIEKINKELKVKNLDVKNNSFLHKGHLGDDGSMETHFAVIVEAEELKVLSRLKAHQKINNILRDEFKNGLHALEINVL